MQEVSGNSELGAPKCSFEAHTLYLRYWCCGVVINATAVQTADNWLRLGQHA